MAGWVLIKRRVGMAAAALRGDWDHRAQLEAWAAGSEFAGERMPWSASQWVKAFQGWLSAREFGMDPSARDASYRAGMGMLDALGAMDARAKSAVLALDRRRDSIGGRLLDCARAGCDRSSREWAAQQVNMHSMWCLRSGQRVGPVALDAAASSASRAAWWDISAAWARELSAIARSQALGSAGLDDTECFALCESAAAIGGRAFMAASARGGRLDERAVAAWGACCEWPWPERPVGHEALDWTRRRWREAYFGIDPEPFEAACQELSPESTWGELAMAKLAWGYEVARLPDEHGAIGMLRRMFVAGQEGAALRDDAPQAASGEGPARL